MERFDVLDCRGEKTGETVDRDEAHRTGVWHGAVHCLVVYEVAGSGRALFQKRSMKKKIAPGKFDVSVGGHYASGENAAAAGPRETGEELGLDVRSSDFVPVGRRVFVYCFEPGVRECEFQDVFLLPRTIRPEALVLQEEEVEGVVEVDINTGIELFAGKRDHAEAPFFGTGGKTERVVLSPRDFVPCLDNYYLKMLQLGRRYLRGEREALVV